MEEKFYLDDFELSLKEHANQFKMVPSKKVWHGIYNDLHPGRRWPSVMISLLLIFSIVFVGYINTNTDKKTPDKKMLLSQEQRSVTFNNPTSKAAIAGANGTIPSAHVDQTFTGTPILKQHNQYFQDIASSGKMPVAIDPPSDIKNKSVSDNNNSSNSINGSAFNLPATSIGFSNKNFKDLNRSGNFPSGKLIEGTLDLTEVAGLTGKEYFEIIQNKPDFSRGLLITPLTARTASADEAGNIVTVQHNKNLLAFNAATKINNSGNRPTATQKKRNEKISWVYYAGASLNMASLGGQPLRNITQNSTLVATLPQVAPKDMRVIHSPSIGFEAGLQMNYALVPRLQFTIGADFTRSGYNITSNLVHPTLSRLVLNDPSTGGTYTRSFVTHYGDGTGMSTVSLPNYSYQASIPVGLQYMVWANDKLQVNLGGSVQPSYVMKADAYVLSSDGKNYVNVPDLLRKWNVSSNFAPFISFKSHNVRWNIGPNLRYQWLSTYEKNYPVKEHLIDYGIRVGITK